MDRLLVATREQYREFVEGAIWQDIREYLTECLSLNRDLLEGVKQASELSPESDDMLRGRNRQIRELLSYVNEMANPSSMVTDLPEY